jgi:polysaccharide deacetylase family protein (PEP-CTERM system associated)
VSPSPASNNPVGAGKLEAHHSTLLLSIDFEDWHQLVRRRVGAPSLTAPVPALRRQTESALELLDELGVKATFFVLGMAARSHPSLVQAIAQRGHEIGCHGDQHVPVYSQTPREFASDLRTAQETIERLTGCRPTGYRAPAFSITEASSWAYEVLASEGFAYDASQHDSPRVRQRISEQRSGPHVMELGSAVELWEFPVAVYHAPRARVPVGGPSYWAVLPRAVILKGLRQAPMTGLYLHPYELDPERLRPLLDRGTPAKARIKASARALQRNVTRLRAEKVLRTIAERFTLISYGEAHARLAGSS